MPCNHDWTTHGKVTDSRREANKIRRRRRCQVCDRHPKRTAETFTTYEITAERYKQMEQIEQQHQEQCELNDKVWAVITSRGIEKAGMTYPEAEIMVEELRMAEEKEDLGTCIISIVAAQRMKKK